MKSRKSMLLSYMRQKHKQQAEAATALFTLFVFISLVLALSNTTVAATAMATAHANLPNYMNSYPATGMIASQSAALTAMWILSLALLVPIELSLRKK